MRCYGLTLPGSDHNRFFIPTITLKPTPNPITRITFGKLGFPKIKATLNDGIITEKSSFYDLLGVTESVSLMEIKHAYKQLARKYHPDVSPSDRVEEYTKRFIQLREAYETLSDPSRRAMYDKHMARGIHLAFNARKTYYYNDQESEEKLAWKARLESQLAGLKRRSQSKNATGNMTWAARMRQQREEDLS